MSQYGEASALAIVETHAPSTEPGLQNAILFAQKRNQICLLTMNPPTHRHDSQLKQSHARSLGDRIDPVVGQYGVGSELFRIVQNPERGAALTH